MRSKQLKNLISLATFQFGTKKYHEPDPTKSVYKRDLPKMLIPFSSVQGKRLLKESIQTGYGQCFPMLIQQFVTQQQPTTCGTATLAIILNALQVDPKQNWKGMWRWYDDYNIKGLTDQQIMQGVTIQQWHKLAIMNGLNSMYFHPKETQYLYQKGHKNQSGDNLTFLSDNTIYQCIKACTRRSNFPMSININRSTLEQTGSGHFSPIAAFHQKTKMVLFLDTAKFKYPLYWTPLDKVIESLKPIDKVSKLPRGLILNRKWGQARISSIFCDWQADHSLNQILHNNIRKLNADKVDSLITPSQFQLIFDDRVRNLLVPIIFDLLNQNSQSGKGSSLIVKEIQQQKIFQQWKVKYENHYAKQTNYMLSQFCSSQSQKKIVQFIIYLSINDPSLIEFQGKQIQKFVKKLKVYFDLPFK